MPQLDLYIAMSQVFWFTIFFLGFYVLIVRDILPAMARSLKLRQKKVDAGNNKGGGKNNDNIVKVDTRATVNANVSIVQNKIKIAKEMDSTLNG